MLYNKLKKFFNKNIYYIASFYLWSLVIIFTPARILAALGIISMKTFQIIGIIVGIVPYIIMLLIAILFG